MTKMSFYDMAVKALRFHEEMKRQKVSVYKWPPHTDEFDQAFDSVSASTSHTHQEWGQEDFNVGAVGR